MRYLISNQPNLFDLKGFTVIDVDKSIEILSRWPEVQVDTETTGLVHTTDKILLLQLGIYEDQLLYDIASFNGQIPDKLKAYMNNDDRLYLGQNIKFDLKFLFWQGVWLKKVYDTMIVEQMINNDGEKIAGRNSLDGLTRKYCQVELDKSIRGDIIKYGLNSAVLDYGAKDVTYLGKIRDGQMKIINEWDMGKAVEIENQAILFIAYMEFCGVKLDSEKWMEKCAKDTKNKLDSISALNKWLMDNGHMEFFDGAADLFTGERACKINWSSQKQVIPVFEKLGLDLWVEEKGTRKKSISEKYIAKYAKTYPLVALYLDYQGYTKLCSTYGMNWFDMIDGQTDRIHTVFHQLGTNTGRLSSGNSRENKPNLQNLPNDAFTRSCFCAEEGSKICATDFSGLLTTLH